MSTFSIRNPTRIFNLDEAGFFMRGMPLWRSKRVGKTGERGNTREIKFRGTLHHVTLMLVISAAGQILIPIVAQAGQW